MAKYAWPAGSTSKTVLLFIQDSASTTGAGRASVSAGNIVASEIRVLTNNTVERATVSVTNLAALTDAYLSGGIFPVEPVTCPGWYRFDIPNTALSTGAITAGISIIGSLSASNIAQLALEIQLQNTPADIVAKAGVSVSVSTLFPVVVRQWDATSVSSSNLAVTDFTARINANVQQWSGASVSTNNIALWASVSTANVTQWAGNATSLSDLAIQDTTDSRLNVNVAAWQGVSVSTNNIAIRTEISLSVVNVTAWAGISTSTNDIALKDTLAAGTDITGTFDVNAVTWAGAATATDDIALFNAAQLASAVNAITVNVGTWSGASVSTNSIVFRSEISLSSVNVTAWAGVSVSASNAAVQNQPMVNVRQVQSISLSGSGTAANPWVPIA